MSFYDYNKSCVGFNTSTVAILIYKEDIGKLQ
jgi:hypothetical protein